MSDPPESFLEDSRPETPQFTVPNVKVVKANAGFGGGKGLGMFQNKEKEKEKVKENDGASMNSLSVKSVRFEDDVGKVTEEAVKRVEVMTEMKEKVLTLRLPLFKVDSPERQPQQEEQDQQQLQQQQQHADDNNSMTTISTFDPLEIFSSAPAPSAGPPPSVIGMELTMPSSPSPSLPLSSPPRPATPTASTAAVASSPPASAQQQRKPTTPRSSPLRRDFDSQSNKAVEMLNRIEKELAHLRSEEVRVSQELAEEQLTLLLGTYKDQLESIQSWASLFEENGWAVQKRPSVDC
ncbi:hypothetical protein TrST_g1360 [Triparma strigata]|uniref:Uncharacterized protein n=1 Tax=Triparma strigata TaxID=1606541 RepID=A0A9W7BMG7_9STRA|nr:hypothetical protein TrST_g1360 [Triparma strigata]